MNKEYRYPTEEPIEITVNNKVAVEPTEDMRIKEMRTIVDLKNVSIIE